MSRIQLLFALLIGITHAHHVTAAPWISPGDPTLRHDLHVLADAGLISTPMMAWPLPWGSIISDLDSFKRSNHPIDAHAEAALDRVKIRILRETRLFEPSARISLAASKEPPRLRGFFAEPRANWEANATIGWTGERFASQLAITTVNGDPIDGQRLRLDGSWGAMALGNWLVTIGMVDRWWGAGWDDNLILSTNTRPIPALSVQRNFPDRFESAWLRWLGPWSTSIVMGQLENQRVVPQARFFGWQFNFKPLPTLELALERTAQWCGKERPCGLGTFLDLLAGRDNVDAAEIRTEPGNQLAGLSIRYVSPFGALYAQVTGEDEAGGLPSRHLGLLGIERALRWHDHNILLRVEAAGTTCGVISGDRHYDCAYRHHIYRSGYRYRGRVIGSSLDEDSRALSISALLVSDRGPEWFAAVRHADLNRHDLNGSASELAGVKKRMTSLNITHRRGYPWAHITVGIGFDWIRQRIPIREEFDVRAFVQWRSNIQYPMN